MRPQARNAELFVPVKDMKTVFFLTSLPLPLLCDYASNIHINCNLFLFKRDFHILLFYSYFLLFYLLLLWGLFSLNECFRHIL